MSAAITNLTWSAVVGLAILLAVFCFLAVLWSRREWNTRKIRVGLFMEREYRTDEEEEPVPEEDTKAYGPDEWPTKHD